MTRMNYKDKVSLYKDSYRTSNESLSSIFYYYGGYFLSIKLENILSNPKLVPEW